MEIDITTPRVVDVKKRTTILDKTTLLDRGIFILNLDKFMWIQTKHIYDKHVEKLENWKNINKEE
jgi:hypothetical protein